MPLVTPKINPKSLSKINKPGTENFGESQLDIKFDINNVVKKGKPKAITSTITFWLMYWTNSNLNFSYNWKATINAISQDTMLKVSFTKPLKVATTHDIKIILITTISIILKYAFSKKSIKSNQSKCYY